VGYTQTQPYIIIKHMRVVNNDASNHTIKLFKGATGASAVGTEVAFSGTTIGANSFSDWYGQLRLDSADFLTGFADVANKLTLNIDAEIGIS
jgi:vacuolar-type H+-ATPase subunit B/Vma2